MRKRCVSYQIAFMVLSLIAPSMVLAHVPAVTTQQASLAP